MVLGALDSEKSSSVGRGLADRFTNQLLISPVQTSDIRYGKDLHLQLCTEVGLPNYL